MDYYVVIVLKKSYLEYLISSHGREGNVNGLFGQFDQSACRTHLSSRCTLKSTHIWTLYGTQRSKTSKSPRVQVAHELILKRSSTSI